MISMFVFFFFPSRRRHTRLRRDWSSDVCSSDLITIRTLVFSGDEYTFQAGAGIVADSVPAREYREVLAKSAILRRALEIAGEGF